MPWKRIKSEKKDPLEAEITQDQNIPLFLGVLAQLWELNFLLSLFSDRTSRVEIGLVEPASGY